MSEDGLDLTQQEWRVGRSVFRTVYARVGGDDLKADVLIGLMDTRELAAEVVAAHNEQLGRQS